MECSRIAKASVNALLVFCTVPDRMRHDLRRWVAPFAALTMAITLGLYLRSSIHVLQGERLSRQRSSKPESRVSDDQ